MARPRSFDLDDALQQAVQLFWKKGYEGTSLTDLTEAMGINRPSLYAAFGSKEALFLRALERYAEGPGARVREAMAAPTARLAVKRLLDVYVEGAGDDHPRGCFMVQGALACSDGAEPMKLELAARRSLSEQALVVRLERARSEGDLPREAQPAALARYVWAVCYGLSVMAAGGASRDELAPVARQVLRHWPQVE